jgi:putative ABC transport system permease protein
VHRLRLLVRGLWWRRGLTLAVLAVAAVTTTAAALGPLYARAAAESILQDHLVQAGARTGLRVSGDVEPGVGDHYAALSRRAAGAAHVPGYDRVIRGMFTPRGVAIYVPRAPLGAVNSYLLWRAGQCAQVVVVSGRCPTAAGEAMASERSVVGNFYNLHLGQRVQLSPVSVSEYVFGTNPGTPKPLHVVGVYRPRNVAASFWFDQNYFGPHGAANDPKITIDPLLVTAGEFRTMPPGNDVEADYDHLLTPSMVRLNDESTERRAMQRTLGTHLPGLHTSSGLLPVLGAADREHGLIDVGTLLVVLQLALLAWLVLFQVVSNAVEARGDEIAMAKLRGYGALPTLRFGLGEPITLLAIAVPLGLLAAIGVAHLFAAAVLVDGVPVLLPWSAVGAALLAFAGGLIAAALAAQRTLSRSVLDQWRHTERRPGRGWVALVVDVLLAAAAIAGVVVLRERHAAADSGDTTALLAPALLVFAVGIIGVRLLPPLCRRLATATRGTRWVGTFLAACQVARRPVGLRLAALLAVAVGLATFGVAGETVTSSNRAARADAEVGASRLASVQFAPGLDPVRATHRADPDGSWAMAAATWLPDGGNSVVGTVLGVDPDRLAAVGQPVRGGPGNRELARLITAPLVPPVTIHASAMRVTLTAADLHGDALPAVQLNLRDAQQPYLNVEGAAIKPGTHRYTLRTPCSSGCALRGLTWDRPISAERPLRGTITMTSLQVRTGTGWRPIDLRLATSSSWYQAKPEGQATDHVTVGSHGVVDTFSNRNGGYGGITYGADPSPIPAVATPGSMATDASAPKIPAMTDADSVTVQFHIQRFAPLLPQVLDNGLVMNVQYLEDELPAFASEATWYVWLGPGAPADYRTRLADSGLQVVGVRTLAGRADELARQAPALALLLLLACALAGAVLAVGGTAISISASSRRRSYELAALRVVGVSRPSLLRAGVIEQLLLLGTAVVLGVPAGYVAARLAMPIIPEFSDTTPVTQTYTPHAVPTVVFAAAFTVLLVLTAVVAAQALIRVAVPARLREAE